MSNSGDVVWRYRWGGWGLARTHTDKKVEGGVSFRGWGQKKTGEGLELCRLQINVIWFLFKNHPKSRKEISTEKEKEERKDVSELQKLSHQHTDCHVQALGF